MKPDPQVPARDTLLDPGAARSVLDAALTEVGASCVRARPTQVRYIPASSITVRYRCDVVWADDSETTEVMVAMAGSGRPSETLVVEVDDAEVAVWRYPYDPLLPGLAAVTSEEGLSQVLGQLGAPTSGLTFRSRVYRPGRRAVIEVATARDRIFIKVVRPKRARALQTKHAVISETVPVPHSFGWSEEMGVIALQAIPGETLRTAVMSDQLHHPTAGELMTLVERIPRLEQAKAVGGPLSRVSDHARLIDHVSPALADRVAAVADAVGSPGLPRRSVHGDFHSSQIIVNNHGLTGMIDVDSAGPGDPTDDMAMMIAQLSVLSLGDLGHRFANYGQSLLAGFEQAAERSDLRRRVAAACLGFAAGPFRVQQHDWRQEMQRRVALAEQWIASA